MKAWHWLAGLGVLAGGALLTSSSKPDLDGHPSSEDEESDKPDPDGGPLPERGRELIAELGRRAGFSEGQIRFLQFVALGESGWNPRVGAGDPALFPVGIKVTNWPGEARASRIAFKRIKHIFADSMFPDEQYEFGSGGLFAMLAPYGPYQLRHTELRNVSPFEIFDPAFAVVTAYAFARGVTRHSNYRGTVESLRAGWGSLRRMGDPARYAHKLPKWRRHAERMGLPASYINEPAPKFPKRDLVEMYRQMGGHLLPRGPVA